MTDRRTKNAEIFSDTKNQYQTNPLLFSAVQNSIKAQVFVPEDAKIELQASTNERRSSVLVNLCCYCPK